jgi:hypothetical protein
VHAKRTLQERLNPWTVGGSLRPAPTFWCRFGLRNMGVTQAGSNAANSGHHHLLIDVNDPLDPNEPIPQDKTHLHFGAGQTEARIELQPGKHTLQLVLGDAELWAEVGDGMKG